MEDGSKFQLKTSHLLPIFAPSVPKTENKVVLLLLQCPDLQRIMFVTLWRSKPCIGVSKVQTLPRNVISPIHVVQEVQEFPKCCLSFYIMPRFFSELHLLSSRGVKHAQYCWSILHNASSFISSSSSKFQQQLNIIGHHQNSAMNHHHELYQSQPAISNLLLCLCIPYLYVDWKLLQRHFSSFNSGRVELRLHTCSHMFLMSCMWLSNIPLNFMSTIRYMTFP